MREQRVNKKYCFTEQEFQILSGSVGLEKFYGFEMQETEVPEARELHELLFCMIKKGFLKPDEDGYQITEEIRYLFEKIKEADFVMTVRSFHGECPDSCIYLGREAVRIEVDGRQGRYLKGNYGETEDIREELLEELSLPQIMGDAFLYRKEAIRDDQPEFSIIKEALSVAGNAERGQEDFESLGILSIIEKRDGKTAQIQQRLLLWEEGISDWIIEQIDEQIHIYSYSGRKLDELLKKMMENGEER